MNRILSALAIGGVSLCLLATTGCSDQTRNPNTVEFEADKTADEALANVSGLSDANWSLDAEPGAVRAHQRVDPATGQTIELTDAQRDASEYDEQSALERHASTKNRKAKEGRVTFGDPKAETQAIR